MIRGDMLQSIINLIEILSFDSMEEQTLDGATHLIGRAARDIFSADSYAFVTINPVTGDLLNPMKVVNLDSNNQEVAITLEINPDILNMFCSQAIASLGDLPDRDQYARIFESVPDVKSMFGMAIGKRGTQKPIAIVFLAFTEEENFCEEAKSILRVFINHASPVLRNLWLLHRYQEVQRIGQEINQGLDTPDNLFQQLKDNVSTLLDTSCFFMVATYEPNTDTLDYYMSEYGKSLPVQESPVEGGGTAWVIRNKQELLIRHFRKEISRLPVELVHLAGTDTVEPQSLIYVPLIFRDAILGVLSIQHTDPNIFDDDDVQILKLLGNQIAMALNNMRLFRNLRSLNETGQTLTRQLDSKEVLQTVVDEIRERTKTDIVILFPYIQAQKKVDLSPTMSGEFYYPNSPRLRDASPDDIAVLALNHGAPVFDNSADLYEKLGGQPERRLGNFEQREQLSSTAVVPLRVGDETVGVLFINYRQPQQFDAPQRHLILGLSNYAAIAIENSRKFSELIRNRTQELNILRTIAREISKTLDLDQILNTILSQATEHLQQRVGFERLDAAVLLYNAAEHCLEVKAAYGHSAAARVGHKVYLSNDKGITGWVYENKQSARVDNVLTDPMWSEIYYSVDKETKSELDVPLIIEDKVEGILNFESREPNTFTTADEDFLWNLAEQVVLAIRNAKAYTQQMRIAGQLTAFGAVGKKLAEAKAYEEVCSSILETGLKAVNANAGQVVMLDQARGELHIVAQKGAKEGLENHRQSINEGVVGWAIRNKQTVMCKIDEQPWSDMYVPIIPNVYYELVSPIIIDGEARGALNIEKQVDIPFTEQDKQYLDGMAFIASTALQNATNVQRADEGRLRLSALRNIDQQIISQLGDSHKVMTVILEDAIKQTDAETGNLYLFRDAKPDSTYFAERGTNEAWKIVRQISTELKPVQLDEISAMVAQNRTPEMVSDLRNGENTIQSVIAAPLVSGEELVGVLNIRSNAKQAFNEEDKELLTLLAGQAVIAIQYARAYAQSKAAEKLFSRLYDTGRELAKFTDTSQINDVYDAVIAAAEKLTPPKSKVLIWRFEEGNPKPLKLAAQGSKPTAPPPERMGTDEGVNGLVSRVRKQIVVPDAKNPPTGVTPAVYDPNTRSIVVTPILFDKYYYGNVALSHEEAFHFRDSKDPEVRLMRGLTRQLAITLNRLETVEARRHAEETNKEAEIMSLFGQGAFEMSHRIEGDLGLVKSYVNNVKETLKTKGAMDADIGDKLDNVLRMLSTNSINGDRDLEPIKSYLEDLTAMLKDKDIHYNDILSELGKVVRDVNMTLAFSERLKQDIAQFERDGAFNLPREVVPALVLLTEAKRDFPPFPTNRTITLVDDPCSDDLGKIYVVPRHIVSILTTFVSNALDAMPEGGTITVTARNAEGQIALDVTDTGIGIPKDIQPKIFKFMYSTKGSSGFGLWSAFRYARLNSGSITVNSEPGVGTTFTLTLPTAENAPKGN